MKTGLLIALLLAALAVSGCGKARERLAADATARAQAPPASATAAEAASPPQAGSQADATPSSPPDLNPGSGSAGCRAPAPTGQTVESLDSGGMRRSYRLYVPTSYDASRPTALVLNFHGFGSNAVGQDVYSRYPQLAEAEGFIVATPDGTNDPQRWYIYGQLEPGYVDDFAFVEALIDHLAGRLCIDQSRVYATGISNGGGMTAQLACRLSGRIAAIAPVAGAPYAESQCRGAGPMPVISFHGTDDQSVPFEGGPGGRLGLPLRAVRDNMRGWAQHNGCDPTLRTQRVAADVVLESYAGCDAGADVQLYVIEGGGHTWPGAERNVPGLGHTTRSISATELSWRFFAAHPKP